MLRVLESPSASERLDRACEFVRRFPAGSELLLIGATREAIDDFARELSLAATATFGLHRFSLTQFAARIAAAGLARQRLAPSTSLGAEATAARSAFEASCRGVLKYFLPVVGRPGFSRALAATVSELRLKGAEAGEVALIGDAGSDVAELMRHFEEQLAKGGLADRSRLFQIALESIDGASTISPVGKPILLLDVALHTESERAFVIGLIDRASEALATVPAGDKHTLDGLSGVQGAQHMALPATGTNTLARLQNTIFGDSTAAAEPDGRVKAFSHELYRRPHWYRNNYLDRLREDRPAYDGVRLQLFQQHLLCPKL
jgi:hypothetical protein